MKLSKLNRARLRDEREDERRIRQEMRDWKLREKARTNQEV